MASQDSTTEGSKNSSSDENHKTLHSRFPAPGQATRPPSPSSESKSDDASGTSTPPPKTDQQHKKEKKKKQPSPPASISSKTAATKMLAKRRREEQQKEEEEENDGIREPPTKKKTLHSVQQESPPKQNKKKKVAKEEPVSTPLSPQNSSKKVARGWTPKDELAFFNGLLACSKSGKGLPKNVASYYDNIRNTMDNHFSNRQLSDKASRWKAKFRAAKDKMKANTLNFKSEHEAVMYNICNQLWGGLDEGGAGNEEIDEDRSVGGDDAENVRKASMTGKKEKKKKKKKQPVLPKEEEDMQKTEDQEDQGKKKGERGR
jgi:hypothetical protein